MADRNVDLKLNRTLIDPNFDGYKLSLEPLPQYQVVLDAEVDNVKLSDRQYSYQHVKAFGISNHLHLDPWNQHLVFWIDQRWKMMEVAVVQDSNIQPPAMTFQIPNAGNLMLMPDRLHVTLQFPTSDWLVLADGAGHLFLIQTGDRKQETSWKICYQGDVVGEGKPFALLSASLHRGSAGQRLDCLLLHVERNDTDSDEEKVSAFTTILEWITMTSGDGEKWEVSRTRRLRGSSCPDYATVDEDSSAVLLAGEKPFKFVYDSVKPVEASSAANGREETEKPPPAYTWSQSSEDVTVQFTVGKPVSKADVLFKLTGHTVELGVKNEELLLDGALAGAVDVDASTWTLDTERQRLELHLEKTEPSTWPTVVEGDDRGEMTLDPEVVSEIHERLASLTSDQWNPAPDPGEEKPYNAQELEECDACPGGSLVLHRLDGDTHTVTHQMNLGSHQWLLNLQSETGSPLAICLRHDVDGIVWQPSNQERAPGVCPFDHVATFNAFGYVQASKQQKKFTTCAPNFSYAALCDCVRHVYIYRQPSAITSPLRNRKTGREVGAVAKQQLISLESVEDIAGLRATNERLFILAGKTLYVARVNN